MGFWLAPCRKSWISGVWKLLGNSYGWPRGKNRFLGYRRLAWWSTPSLSPFSSHSSSPSSLAATFPRICKCSAQCQPNAILWPSHSTPLRVLHKHPQADKPRGGKGPRSSHALAALLWPTADLVGREGWQCLVPLRRCLIPGNHGTGRAQDRRGLLKTADCCADPVVLH